MIEIDFVFINLLPSILVFVIVYSLLEKLKIFGSDKIAKRINLIIAFSIFLYSLIFSKKLYFFVGISMAVAIFLMILAIINKSLKKLKK